MGITTAPATGSPACDAFLTELAAMGAPRVLELGTRRWEPDRPTHHRAWAPHAARYIGADIGPGTDVDVIADAHTLTDPITGTFAPGSFDAVIAVSVWEHLARPWIAAAQVAAVLAPGGIAYIGTHQSFPLHGYPEDWFRFSREALALLFTDAGMVDIVTAYQYPVTLTPPREVTRWNPAAEAFLNVDCYARKP